MPRPDAARPDHPRPPAPPGSRARRPLWLLALLGLAWAGPAGAHYVWLESDGGGAGRAYFGEWHNGEIERSGGRLDAVTPERMLSGPPAAGADDGPAGRVTRRDDHLEIAAGQAIDLASQPVAPAGQLGDPVAGAGDLWLSAATAVREDKTTGARTRTRFHVPAGRKLPAARLDLELAPTALRSDTYVPWYQGRPLADTPVTAFCPPRWQNSLTTDAQGRVSVPTPWAGRYVLQASHADGQPGEAGGQRFDQTRHVATLSFVSDRGLPWVDAPAAAAGPALGATSAVSVTTRPDPANPASATSGPAAPDAPAAGPARP